MINDLWYKNAVIYCLSVATYMDANGDGIGDFQGLMFMISPITTASIRDMAPSATLSNLHEHANSAGCVY
jgi:hypothetical protein